MFNREWFFDLEKSLIKAGLDSDLDTFAVIKKRLATGAAFDPDEFARQAIYVVLAGGFSQKTAKKKHSEIMEYLHCVNAEIDEPTPRCCAPTPAARAGVSRTGKSFPQTTDLETSMSSVNTSSWDTPALAAGVGAQHRGVGSSGLLSIFNNKNKINAIIKIWEDRERFCNEYYSLESPNEKLEYLSTLPHIGKITANHLARNLGHDIVKYDVWVQRLGHKYAPDIDSKKACDEMFSHLVCETGLPRGYIDVVLWKAAQNGFIKDLK